MHSVFAIARVTLKDALRKKVLVTILFFAALLMVASGLLPWVRPDEQMQKVSKTCLAGISFFGMIVAIFLSAPNLPDDISRKTIFTVMTKPARRSEILLGKILGLGYVLAIMLVVMGLMSYGYIRFWAWKLGDDSKSPGRLEANKAIYAKSVEFRGLSMDISAAMIESERAIASGFDRITFHFENLAGEQFSGSKVFAQVRLFKHSWDYDSVTGEGTAALQVRNPSTGETQEYVFGAQTLRPVYEGFPVSLVDKDGRLEISVVRHLPSGSYSAMAGSVAVLAQPSSYGVNFVKALAMMFLQYMLLVFVATAASTFLTSTVSVIMALFIYFTGSLTDVLREQALALGTSANIFTMAEHTHEARHETFTGMTWIANVLLRYFYLGISIVFPNLSRYDTSGDIAANWYITPETLFSGVAYAAFYGGLCFLVAWLVFRRKEVA